jgi:hypothetical protein
MAKSHGRLEPKITFQEQWSPMPWCTSWRRSPRSLLRLDFEREREQHNYMGNRPFIETWEKWLKIQVQEIPEDLSSLKIGNGNFKW